MVIWQLSMPSLQLPVVCLLPLQLACSIPLAWISKSFYFGKHNYYRRCCCTCCRSLYYWEVSNPCQQNCANDCCDLQSACTYYINSLSDLNRQSPEKTPYNDRDFLLMFNLMLLGVMGIIIFSVSGTSVVRNQKFNAIVLFVLSVITILSIWLHCQLFFTGLRIWTYSQQAGSPCIKYSYSC